MEILRLMQHDSDEVMMILDLDPWVQHQGHYYISLYFWVQYLLRLCYGNNSKGSLEVDGHHKYSSAWPYF